MLHQGFPRTATAPAIRLVTALLAEGRAHPDTVEALVEFLGDAASCVTALEGNRHFVEVWPDVADAVTAAYPVVLALWEFWAPDRALFYAEHLVALAAVAAPVDRRRDLLRRDRTGRVADRRAGLPHDRQAVAVLGE